MGPASPPSPSSSKPCSWDWILVHFDLGFVPLWAPLGPSVGICSLPAPPTWGLSSSQPLGLRAHVFQGHVMSLQPLVLGSEPLSLELCSHLSPPSCHSHHGGPQQPRCARPEVPLSAWLSAAPHLSWRRGGRSLTTGRAPRRTWPPGAGGAGR